MLIGYHHTAPCTQCWHCVSLYQYIDGLVQDCSNSSALALELLQSCTKPSTCIQFNHCGTRFSSGNKKNMFAFYTIPQHWDVLGCWKHSLWKKRTCSSCIVNTMVADDLVTQGHQGICCHGTNSVLPEYSNFNSRRFMKKFTSFIVTLREIIFVLNSSARFNTDDKLLLCQSG